MVGIAIAEEQAGEVLVRAAAGDELAFTRIVAAHHLDMRRVAYVICRDPDLAEDACQQAWQIAWRKLSGVRQPSSLRPWLVAVAANEARKLASRQRQRRVLEASVRPIRQPSDDPGADIDLLDLEYALGRLKPDDRALLAMKYRAGLAASEIALVRGGSPSGVRARIGRLLDRLRKDLQDG